MPQSLGYSATLPAGYAAERIEGVTEPLKGETAVGPSNAAGTLSATISVFVEPDVVHGGLWQDENTQADHELAVLSSLPSSHGFRLVEDTTTTIDGVSARSVTFDVGLWLAHINASALLPIETRQHILYAKHGNLVFRISLLADAADFTAREAEFNRFLSSFRFD